MRHERAGHTLQASALVNEAYLRLIDANQVRWQDRRTFSESRRISCGVFSSMRPGGKDLPNEVMELIAEHSMKHWWSGPNSARISLPLTIRSKHLQRSTSARAR